MDFRLEDPAAPSGLKMHLASPNQMAQVGRSPTEYFVLAPQVHGMTSHSTVQKKPAPSLMILISGWAQKFKPLIATDYQKFKILEGASKSTQI